MMMLVLAFNKPSDKKAETVVAKSRILDVKRQEQVKQNEAKSQPKSEPKQAPANNNALPDIGSMVGGIAMNIPELSLGGLIQDAASLLDEGSDDGDGSVDTSPKVLTRTEMEYPSNAAKEGLHGYVVVNVLIDTDGNVEMVKVLESQPSGVFDDAAMRGVKDWKFTPAMSKGKPVKMWAKQKIKFN
ncbi:MAG: energy transducer TonB [Sulfuricurvum sp.]|nr:energy transducer TonB [Sulfuricurvum sp.]